MKRIFIFLAFCGMTLALASCGKDSGNDPDGPVDRIIDSDTISAGGDSVDDEPVVADSLSVEETVWYVEANGGYTIVLFQDGKAYGYSATEPLSESGTIDLSLVYYYTLSNTTPTSGTLNVESPHSDMDGGTMDYTLAPDSLFMKGVVFSDIRKTKYKDLLFALPPSLEEVCWLFYGDQGKTPYNIALFRDGKLYSYAVDGELPESGTITLSYFSDYTLDEFGGTVSFYQKGTETLLASVAFSFPEGNLGTLGAATILDIRTSPYAGLEVLLAEQ